MRPAPLRCGSGHLKRLSKPTHEPGGTPFRDRRGLEPLQRVSEGRGLEDPQCGQKHPAKILYQKDDVKAVSPGALKKCTRVGAKIHRAHREVPEPLHRESVGTPAWPRKPKPQGR